MSLVASSLHSNTIVRIPSKIWRAAAEQHETKIRNLLQPGLTPKDHLLNGGMTRRRRQQQSQQSLEEHWATALDPKHPVYNFLIEYYGLKGAKGPRRLARWCPSPGLLLLSLSSSSSSPNRERRIESIEELEEASSKYSEYDPSSNQLFEIGQSILLEDATEDDFAQTLHLRGAIIPDDRSGVIYSPGMYFHKDNNKLSEQSAAAAAAAAAKSATSYLWYRSILQQTLLAEPILHCHGLHEWAMQYQPVGAPPPPSAKYQSHLSLRVSRDIINAAVERRGISCTHVDALRFFAPAAGPLNHHGSNLQRTDQLRLEQPACVHAHMDLLKIALKLRPFIDSVLLQNILEIALESRKLDVAASPYDASEYGVGVVPIETKEGRKMYRSQQIDLMKRVEPIRKDLLRAYDLFLDLAFSKDAILLADKNPLEERFAKAEPGGLPWRQNLISDAAREQKMQTN